MNTPADVLKGVLDSATQYERGPAEPGQMPYGEASSLNSADVTPQAPAAAPAGPTPAGGGPPPPNIDMTANDLPDHTPGSDTEKFLLSPSGNSMPAQTMQSASLSQYASYAPLIQQAAAAPDATPTLRALANALAIAGD